MLPRLFSLLLLLILANDGTAERRRSLSPFPAVPLALDVDPFDINSTSAHVWFAGRKDGLGTVARVDMGGSVDYFLTDRILPSNIAVAADGSLWTAGRIDSGVGVFTIARLNDDGSFSYRDLPAELVLSDLAVDTEGRVWYTAWHSENRHDLVGYLAEGDARIEFVLPFANLSSRRLLLGSDGAMWIAHGKTILRVTHLGDLREFTFDLVFPRVHDARAFVDLTEAADGSFYAGTTGEDPGAVVPGPGSVVVRMTKDGGYAVVVPQDRIGNVSSIDAVGDEVCIAAVRPCWAVACVFFDVSFYRLNGAGELKEMRFPQARRIGPSTVGPDGYFWTVYGKSLLRILL